MADAFPLGERIVQRTPGGVIVLRRHDFAVERVILGPAPAAAVGPDGDALLIGWRDGRTARLDPATGRLTDGPTAEGEPVWIGRADDRYVVTLDEARTRVGVLNLDTGHRASGRLEGEGYFSGQRPSAAVAVALAPPLVGEGPPGPALWLGWDVGEWGGGRARVDLRDGHVDAIPSENITGLIAVEGRVLAFGGLDHMGAQSSWIGEVQDQEAQFHRGFGAFDPHGQTAPVHHLIPSPQGFTVLASSEVYATDATFSRWRRLGEVNAHVRSGRPDAVGANASVVKAWHDGEDLVLATRYDGFLRWSRGVTSTPIAAPATGIYLRDLLVADSLVAIVDNGVWRVGDAGFVQLVSGEGYLGAAWDVDPSGDLRRTRIQGGAVITTVWADPRRETVMPIANGSDVLRDGVGALYIGDHATGVRRESGLDWTPLVLPSQTDYLFSWKPISGVAGLFRRTSGGADAVAFVREGALVPIPGTLDAASWEGMVTLLTSSGLIRWDPASDAVSPVAFALPADAALVARDGCGRLWVAGQTLVVEPDRVVSSAGLDGRDWTAIVGLTDGVALTDGAVVAEVRRDCP